MREKSDAIGIFQKFYKMITIQFDAKVKVIRSHNGGEYFSGSLNMFLMDNGIIHESSCTATPEQNSVVERKNRHLLEVAWSFLFARNVTKIHWADVVLVATYLINWMPSKIGVNRAPLESLKGFFSIEYFPNSTPSKVFGLVAFVHIQAKSGSKLETRALKCLFVGYSPHQKGYICYHTPTQNKYVSLNVTFFRETGLFYWF